jgi:hypothetical protein
MPDLALLDRLAATMHETYRRNAKANGWPLKPEVDKPFAELAPDLQEANRAAARRIPEVLAVIGVRILPPSQAQMRGLSEVELYDLVERNMKQLALAEHEGWMRQRIEAGWKYAAERDDAQKLHPCLVPFAELSGEDKEKDRNQVRSYPALLAQAGLVAVKE